MKAVIATFVAVLFVSSFAFADCGTCCKEKKDKNDTPTTQPAEKN